MHMQRTYTITAIGNFSYSFLHARASCVSTLFVHAAFACTGIIYMCVYIPSDFPCTHFRLLPRDFQWHNGRVNLGMPYGHLTNIISLYHPIHWLSKFSLPPWVFLFWSWMLQVLLKATTLAPIYTGNNSAKKVCS